MEETITTKSSSKVESEADGMGYVNVERSAALDVNYDEDGELSHSCVPNGNSPPGLSIDLREVLAMGGMGILPFIQISSSLLLLL